MGTEITTTSPSAFVTATKAQPIIPGTFDSVWEMSALIAASGMAPKDMKTREQIAVAIFHGLEIGLTPMAALQSIAVINGRPSIWGDGALALVRSSPLCVYVKEWFEGEGDKQVAYCEAKRSNGEIIKRSFSYQDAKDAGLLNKDGPWKQYRARMQQMRARSWTLRDGFSDVLRGLAIAEEMQDVQMRDVTPPVPPTPPAPPAAEKATDKPVEENKPEPAAEKPKPAEERKPEPEKRQEEPKQATPPAPPSSGKGSKTIDADPFDDVVAKLDSAMAKCGNPDELKAVWKTAPDPKTITKAQDDRLVAVKDKHVARLKAKAEKEKPADEGRELDDTSERQEQPATDDGGDAQPFDLTSFKADVLQRLLSAKTADEAEQLLMEVDAAIEEGFMTEEQKEQYFTDSFEAAFARLG